MEGVGGLWAGGRLMQHCCRVGRNAMGNVTSCSAHAPNTVADDGDEYIRVCCGRTRATGRTDEAITQQCDQSLVNYDD
jgi:hypothetical protein